MAIVSLCGAIDAILAYVINTKSIDSRFLVMWKCTGFRSVYQQLCKCMDCGRFKIVNNLQLCFSDNNCKCFKFVEKCLFLSNGVTIFAAE